MSSFDASILASWDLFHLQSRHLQTWFNQRPSKWRLYCGESWALSRLFGGGQSSQILDIHFPNDGFEPETPSLLSLVFQKSQQATCFKLIPFLLNLNQCKDDKTESWFRLDFFLVAQDQWTTESGKIPKYRIPKLRYSNWTEPNNTEPW